MKTLETERLILRKFKESDFAAVHSYGGCADNLIYTPFGPNSEEETREFIRCSIADAEQEPCTNRQYAVILKATGELIGGCGVSVSGEEGNIGWLIHRDHWRQGYGTEMGKVLLEYSFGELGLHRVIASCDAENTASYRIMEKIGMRREALMLEARPAKKFSDNAYGDELRYAILKGEWEDQRANEYYNSLPCEFEDFIDLPYLSDGEIHLACTAKKAANPVKKHVPSYTFAVCLGSEKVGEINLRIGYGAGLHGSNLYYGGQIGYNIDEKYRGHGYAGKACRLLLPIAKAHKMEKLLITNADTNAASRRVCEKLGLRHIRTSRVPEWHDLYADMGCRFVNIYEWSVE